MILNRESRRGIALVLTLAVLVIATILVVAFTSSMRTERQAAASLANNTSAQLIAQAAVEHAISILDFNVPQPRPPEPSPTPLAYSEYMRFGGGAISDVSAVNWVTQPGLLTTIARHISTNSDTVRQIPLSSNPDIGYASTTDDANMNPPLLSGIGNLVKRENEEMRVAWIPVLKDPTSAPGVANAITGRYAFWMDDESTKANLNTSFGKTSAMDFTQLTPGVVTVNGASYPIGHPSSVNLDLFGALDRANLATAVGARGGLLSIDEVKGFVTSGSPDDFFATNKFNLTAFGRAPEFNVFGKSKLYFIRRATGELGYPLFQFFRDRDGPSYFPSDENGAGADRHSAYYTAAAIAAYFNRTDWPGMPPDPNSPSEGLSFVKKWDRDAVGNAYPGAATGDVGKREADQVAWNLLCFGSFAAGDFTGIPSNQISGEYYRLANPATSGETGFVSINRPNSDAVIGSLSGKAMLPAYPVPLINEVSLVISPESYTIADGTQKYRLNVSLNVELWLPSGYPSFDFGQSKTTIGLTYLDYHVTQAAPGTANAQQKDAKYVDRSAAPDDNGIRKLWMVSNTGTATPNSYTQVTTTLPFYVSNKSGFNSGANGSEDFTTSGIINLNFKMRLFGLSQAKSGSTYGTKHTFQLLPVWDSRDPVTTAAPTTWNPAPPASAAPYLAAPPDDQHDYIEFQFELDPASFSSGEVITRSVEVADPRMGAVARAWQKAPHFDENATQNADTMGGINNATAIAGYDPKKLAFVDLNSPGPASNHPSTGFLSVVPTGMQRGISGAVTKFQPSGGSPTLPDWLLLDLVAPTVSSANFGQISYMNSTAGQVNVNSQILPNGGKFSLAPRFVPLQALFQNMNSASTVIGATPPAAASAVVHAINNHSLATNGVSYGATSVYDYDGEICEIDGVSNVDASGSATGSDWDKESIIRNLATSITTKSNVFSVWGIAQTVKKNPANVSPATMGVFQTRAGGAIADDIVTGEKRFQAIVERYVWAGADASSGNAHVPANNGSYDQLSSGQTKPGLAPAYSGGTWEKIDGPDSPTYPISPHADAWVASAPNYLSSSLDTAQNPARALMKYRVVFFRYLSE